MFHHTSLQNLNSTLREFGDIESAWTLCHSVSAEVAAHICNHKFGPVWQPEPHGGQQR